MRHQPQINQTFQRAVIGGLRDMRRQRMGADRFGPRASRRTCGRFVNGVVNITLIYRQVTKAKSAFHFKQQRPELGDCFQVHNKIQHVKE